jgi:transcriptional regulator with XRE-family HTH domain
MLLRVKVLRMERDLTQFDVSSASEISQGRYSMIERGLIEPTAEERARLAAVLGTAPSTLFRRAVRTLPVETVGT